jgi:hypothetical protein
MKSLLVVFFLLVAQSVYAAPAVIGTPVVGNSGASATTTVTVSATCPSGNSNVVAVACLTAHKNGGTITVDSVTWNGVGMTGVGTAALEAGSSGAYARLWMLTNPTCDGSAHNLVGTVSGTNLFMVAAILFLKDTDQTTVIGTPATATGNLAAGAMSVNATSASGELVVDCAALRNSDNNMVAGSGQTSAGRSETTNASASANTVGGQSYENGAASVTMNWTDSDGSPTWAIQAVSFLPAAAGRRRMVPPGRFLQLFPMLAPVRVQTLGIRTGEME